MDTNVDIASFAPLSGHVDVRHACSLRPEGSMIESLQRLLRGVMTAEEVPDRAAPTLALSVAALLFEVARADYHLDDSEVVLLRQLLQRRFNLAEADLDDLTRILHLA